MIAATELPPAFPIIVCDAGQHPRIVQSPGPREAPTPGRLLGLTGRAGSGKSTVAKALIEDGGAVCLHFASPLKKMLRAIGLDEFAINGGGKEQPHPLLCGHTPRHAMQTLGTEWGRDCIGPSLWVDLCMADVDRMLAHGIDVVLDDVRFPNEAQAIRERGGTVIKIFGRFAGGGRPGHASEGQLPPDLIRAAVSNHDTIDRTVQAVRTLWAQP